MTKTTTNTQRSHDEILSDSIARGLEITLTHPVADTWQVFRSKLVSGSCKSGELVVELPSENHESVANVPPVGAKLGVTFRLGHKKCMFSTVRTAASKTCPKDCLSLGWPDHLKSLQRRVYQRVEPPKGTVVAVQYWPKSSDSEGGRRERQNRYGELADISAGGMRVDTADANDLASGCVFECLFVPKPGAPPVLTDAILRHREEAAAERSLLGFQFVGLETTPEGRAMLSRLARLVGEYRRSNPSRGQ